MRKGMGECTSAKWGCKRAKMRAFSLEDLWCDSRWNSLGGPYGPSSREVTVRFLCNPEPDGESEAVSGHCYWLVQSYMGWSKLSHLGFSASD